MEGPAVAARRLSEQAALVLSASSACTGARPPPARRGGAQRTRQLNKETNNNNNKREDRPLCANQQIWFSCGVNNYSKTNRLHQLYQYHGKMCCCILMTLLHALNMLRLPVCVHISLCRRSLKAIRVPGDQLGFYATEHMRHLLN